MSQGLWSFLYVLHYFSSAGGDSPRWLLPSSLESSHSLHGRLKTSFNAHTLGDLSSCSKGSISTVKAYVVKDGVAECNMWRSLLMVGKGGQANVDRKH
jgi:hypothetical protein